MREPTRPRVPRLAVLSIAGVAALAVVGWWAWRADTQPRRLPDRPAGFNRASSDLDPRTVRGFDSFPLYWAGTSADGIPLNVIDAGSAMGRARHRDAGFGGPVTFIYSDRHDCSVVPRSPEVVTCEGTQIVISTQVMCRARAIVLDAARPTRVRGTRATRWGRVLDVYTGRVTVRIEADTVARARRLAQALRKANGPDTSGARLPPPAAGHPLERGVQCPPRR